ncbi:MAG TPA: ferredoxin [Candidatus Limnocylindria bacterium]|nr:ferredoxin [Candidatus Limnocylindria bacterium]
MSVDTELCIGSAECVRLLPHAFRIDESVGVAVPLEGAETADHTLLVRARSNCPTHAIAIDDEDGGPAPEEASP